MRIESTAQSPYLRFIAKAMVRVEKQGDAEGLCRRGVLSNRDELSPPGGTAQALDDHPGHNEHQYQVVVVGSMSLSSKRTRRRPGCCRYLQSHRSLHGY